MPALVRVAVKIGDISKSSRTNVLVQDAEFSYDEDAQPFSELCAMIEERVANSLAHYKLSRQNLAGAIQLSESKKIIGPIVIEVFAFATKKTSNEGIRRATMSRVLWAAQSIDQYLANYADVQVGEIARTHWVAMHARHADDSQISVPETTMFRQAQYLDEMRANHDREQLPSSDFHTVTIRRNGSYDLQLSINVHELRVALGLPSYNLMVV